jgi:hypothetical protein
MTENDRDVILSKIWKPEENWIEPEEVLKNPKLWDIEREMCRRNPWYFIIRWIYTKDEVNPDLSRRVRKFPPWMYLKEFVNFIHDHRLTLVPKSRRMTVTWTVMAYMVWECLFHPHCNSFTQSKKDEDAKDLIDKAAHMLKRLPKFIIEEKDFTTMSSMIKFHHNGSRIRAVPKGADIIRMHTATTIFFDEAAFNDEFEDSLKGALPSIEGGGKLIAVSSIQISTFFDYVNDEVDEEDEKDKITSSKKPEVFEPLYGLRYWQNLVNKFWVFEIHYNSHPFKDQRTTLGQKWKAVEQEGKYGKNWNQEYELDIRAVYSSRIYPQFSWENNVEIAEDLTPENIPSDWTRYMALDSGIGAPCACLWLAVEPPKEIDGKIYPGDWYVYDEYYKSNKTVAQTAKEILENEQEFTKNILVRYIDPATTKRNAVTGTTVRDEYAKCGLDFIPANNDVVSGIRNVQNHLEPEGLHVPKLIFLPHLKNTFKEFKKYKHKNKTPVKKNDHLMDCLRYLVQANPDWVDPKRRVRIRKIHDKLTGTVIARIEIEEDIDEFCFPDVIEDRKQRKIQSLLRRIG